MLYTSYTRLNQVDKYNLIGSGCAHKHMVYSCFHGCEQAACGALGTLFSRSVLNESTICCIHTIVSSKCAHGKILQLLIIDPVHKMYKNSIIFLYIGQKNTTFVSHDCIYGEMN